MQILKNCPVDRAKNLLSLIDYQENQVVSMALSRSEHTQIALFSFADGEMVSAESYLGDTLYCLLEGQTHITIDDAVITLQAGETLAVAAGVYHAIGGGLPFKMMQITLNS